MNNWIDFARAHPHEFTIQYPPRREYFQEHFRAELPSGLFEKHDKLGLYLHIPFCEAKCYYCNFAVDVRSSQKLYDNYVNRLIEELDSHALLLEGKTIQGIDIGGGTPTRLPIDLLQRVVNAVQPYLVEEHRNNLSIETTPGIASQEPEKMHMLAEHKVKRVSIGIQSFNTEHLEQSNRMREAATSDLAIQHVRDAGFDKLNIDLIFGLPNQSIESWNEDLLRVIAYQPESITIYDCLYRGKGRILTKRTSSFPSLETYGVLYDHAFSLLLKNGYSGTYGSVNFTKVDDLGVSDYFQSRLLEGLPYLGLGNYASSQVDDYWFFKPYHVGKYIESKDTALMDIYQLPADELYAKYVLYSFNFGFVDTIRFERRFNRSFEQHFERELEFATSQGWLEHKNQQWQLRNGQFKNMNLIRSLFYSPHAKQWMQELHSV